MASYFASESARITWRGYSSYGKTGLVAMALIMGSPDGEHHRWQAIMAPEPRTGYSFPLPFFWAVNQGIPLNEDEARGLFPEHADIWYDDGTCMPPEAPSADDDEALCQQEEPVGE